MPAGTKQDLTNPGALARDPEQPLVTRPITKPRQLNLAWASITDADLRIGEVVVNRSDNSLVWRKDDTTIYRFDFDATRTI